MARVDSTDDEIRRFVVYLHAFDPERHERRPIEIAAFDNYPEAMRCFGETHQWVLARRAAGEADPRDHVTKEPGVDGRNRRRRFEERRGRGHP